MDTQQKNWSYGGQKDLGKVRLDKKSKVMLCIMDCELKAKYYLQSSVKMIDIGLGLYHFSFIFMN